MEVLTLKGTVAFHTARAKSVQSLPRREKHHTFMKYLCQPSRSAVHLCSVTGSSFRGAQLVRGQFAPRNHTDSPSSLPKVKVLLWSSSPTQGWYALLLLFLAPGKGGEHSSLWTTCWQWWPGIDHVFSAPACKSSAGTHWRLHTQTAPEQVSHRGPPHL